MLIYKNYKYSGFDAHWTFSFPSGGFGQNVIIFGADMSFSVHSDNKNLDILVFGDASIQGLDGTTLTGEKSVLKCLIHFTTSRNKFCLSLHDNGADSYLFANST